MSNIKLFESTQIRKVWNETVLNNGYQAKKGKAGTTSIVQPLLLSSSSVFYGDSGSVPHFFQIPAQTTSLEHWRSLGEESYDN